MHHSHKHIHIIAFDIPFPANYGGVIDIYYKIKALHDLGFAVHLHAFQYGRSVAKQLNKVCFSVNYYKRSIYKNPFYGKLPYIVSTRSTPSLLDNLKKDNYPILFEGLHTTFFLAHPELEKRFKMVRMHNIEHDYYQNLEKVERSYFKKYFFRIESEKLKKYQSVLKHANLICAISQNDEKYLKKRFDHVVHLPPFHGNTAVVSKKGKGDYILYHGNLSVAENNEAALYLINSVFSKLDKKCIITGNNPSKELVQAVEGFKHIEIVDKTSSDAIAELIAGAQVNIMHTFQSTGIKLKLLNALFLGRFCIGNKEMIKNTGLEELCIQANTAEEYIEKINDLWNSSFSEKERMRREKIMEASFSDKANAINFEMLIPFAANTDIEAGPAEMKNSLTTPSLKSLFTLFSL